MVRTNDPTRYEIRIIKGDKSYRVCFSARRTRQSLRECFFAIPHARRIEIFDELGTDANFVWDSKTKEFRTADGCAIRFTGATERDIKNVAA